MMRARRLVLFVLVVGCSRPPQPAPSPVPPKAAAPPSPPATARYPMRCEPVDKAEVATRERAFRERNPEPWSVVKFDAHGLLSYAAIRGPQLTALPATPEFDDAEMRVRWTKFLEQNRDVLAIDAPAMKPLAAGTSSANNVIGYAQRWSDYEIGHAQVSWRPSQLSGTTVFSSEIAVYGHGWPVALPAPPKIKSRDELTSSFVGMRGTLRTFYEPFHMPCDPPAGGKLNPCGGSKPLPPPPPPTDAPYTLGINDVALGGPMICHYLLPSGAMEIRIVSSLLIRAPQGGAAPIGGPKVRTSTAFIPPPGTPPFPTRLDAVTGEDISANRCTEGY